MVILTRPTNWQSGWTQAKGRDRVFENRIRSGVRAGSRRKVCFPRSATYVDGNGDPVKPCVCVYVNLVGWLLLCDPFLTAQRCYFFSKVCELSCQPFNHKVLHVITCHGCERFQQFGCFVKSLARFGPSLGSKSGGNPFREHLDLLSDFDEFRHICHVSTPLDRLLVPVTIDKRLRPGPAHFARSRETKGMELKLPFC